MIGKAYSPSAQLGLSYFFLVLGNQLLLWGKEANLKMFDSEYNTAQHSVAQHWIGVSVCVHTKKCASVWMCIRLSFSHFCDLLKSLTVPLGPRVCVPWQWKHITERQIYLAWECQQDLWIWVRDDNSATVNSFFSWIYFQEIHWWMFVINLFKQPESASCLVCPHFTWIRIDFAPGLGGGNAPKLSLSPSLLLSMLTTMSMCVLCCGAPL